VEIFQRREGERAERESADGATTKHMWRRCHALSRAPELPPRHTDRRIEEQKPRRFFSFYFTACLAESIRSVKISKKPEFPSEKQQINYRNLQVDLTTKYGFSIRR